MSSKDIGTVCAHCGSLNGGHTLACQSIHSDTDKPAQIPMPVMNPAAPSPSDSSIAQAFRE